MWVVMHFPAPEEQILKVATRVSALGFTAHRLPGQQRTVIGVTGNEGALNVERFEELAGVVEVIRVSKPYKLVSREFQPHDTIVRIASTGAAIGGETVSVSVLVIASLNGVTKGGWTEYAHLIEQAGADALELNVYYIPTDLRLTGADVEEMYLDVLRDVRATVSIPVATKLSPYFSATA